MAPKPKYYVGVDVGGTKILAAVVHKSGQVLSRARQRTPQGADAETVVATIGDTIAGALREEDLPTGSIAAVGLAVPGVVDPDKGRVLFAPNIALADARLMASLRERFNLDMLLGNDVDLGTLGEQWKGAAKGARNVVGLFPGTGVGGGVIVNNRLVTGASHGAGEIGHTIMQLDGPLCGCGSRGCLEALASRTAIERDLRAAIEAGEPSVLTEQLDDLSRIRSGQLKKALAAEDELVSRVMARASLILGEACKNLFHILDPDVIVLGGGVVEACGAFMMPIIKDVVARDPLLRGREPGRVERSALGDDAVVLGAVKAAKRMLKAKASS